MRPASLHAVLLDIDHTPTTCSTPATPTSTPVEGLERLAARLHPGGVFALWSDDPPEAAFTALLASVFAAAAAHEVTFANPLTGGRSSNTVYVATTYTTRAAHTAYASRDVSGRRRGSASRGRGRPTVR